MKVLVIPDVHLKPWMFRRAEELLKQNQADRAVCLMDIADDWRQQFNLDLYNDTYDEAIRFAVTFPDTLWCYGNHDLSYPWRKEESGYSRMAPWLVCEKLRILRESLPDDRKLAYLHRIDKVLFSHGGLCDEFVRQEVPEEYHDDVDKVIGTINDLGEYEMWVDISPLWFRHRDSFLKMYRPDTYLQVVGHTPVEKLSMDDNVISCDVFSTEPDGSPHGSQEFLLIDTVTWEYRGIR